MRIQNIGTRLQVRRQTWITRDDLRANRDLIYVFGFRHFIFPKEDEAAFEALVQELKAEQGEV